MLQLPQVLVRLPRSLSAVGNEPLAADVHTLAKGKKRKRSELAVAINGEAINLYDVCSLDTTIYTQYILLRTGRFKLPA